MQPEISLILPAFNEAGSIAQTLAEVTGYFQDRGYRYEIIVAADGADGTRELVARLAQTNPALRAIGHPQRRGKGRGVREAVAVAEGRFIGYADADNKVPISEFDKVYPLLCEGRDVVIGSRRLEQSATERAQPLYRRAGSRGFLVFMQLAVGLPGIRDTQCGFKFFSRAAAKTLFAEQRIDGYMFDVEILALARRHGYAIAQVPVRWRDDHDSRYHVVSGSLRNLRDIFRIRRSLRAGR